MAQLVRDQLQMFNVWHHFGCLQCMNWKRQNLLEHTLSFFDPLFKHSSQSLSLVHVGVPVITTSYSLSCALSALHTLTLTHKSDNKHEAFHISFQSFMSLHLCKLQGFIRSRLMKPTFAWLWQFSCVSEDFHMSRVITPSYLAYARGCCAMGGRPTAVHPKVNK